MWASCLRLRFGCPRSVAESLEPVARVRVRADCGTMMHLHFPRTATLRRLCCVGPLLLRRAAAIAFLASCTPPAEETAEVLQEARFRTITVCVAYHDLLGRGAQVDTTNAETREGHRQAMEVCDQVEAEGGEGMGL